MFPKVDACLARYYLFWTFYSEIKSYLYLLIIIWFLDYKNFIKNLFIKLILIVFNNNNLNIYILSFIFWMVIILYKY